MVRVISVHHFAKQEVVSIEPPTASTIAPPDRLLLALSGHCVEVRDLGLNGDVLFTFPTVDEVSQIHYSLNGDFIATLETKFNRQNHELNFVRVYVNWNSIAALQQSKMNCCGASLSSTECGMVQPMRARIAGRVTPSTNQCELASLEMIEIPMKNNPDSISVCPISGNILVQCGRVLNVHLYEVKTHDISKLKFVDFKEMPLNINLSFKPSNICFAENYVACCSSNTLHFFKIITKDEAKVEPSIITTVKFGADEQCVDFQQLISSDRSATIHLPSVLRENSAVHKHSPFMCSQDLKTTLKTQENYALKSLVQLTLKPIEIDNKQKKQQVHEQFKALILKPIYMEQQQQQQKQTKPIGSLFRSQFADSHLKAVVCLFATQQEGYFYQFNDQCADPTTDNCLTVYPFTAPVQQVVLEDYFLHALTEAGLESYTIRSMHQLSPSIVGYQKSPPLSESVCLVSLRPFLSVEKMLLSDSHVVLLASSTSAEELPIGDAEDDDEMQQQHYWTCYSLQLPHVADIFSDFLSVASVHRFTSSQTYLHLINETHMILRAAVLGTRFTVNNDEEKCGGVKTLACLSNGNDSKASDAFRKSALYLGDFFITSENVKEQNLAKNYYAMAKISAMDVLNRMRKLQEQTGKGNGNYGGLLVFLKSALLEPEAYAALGCKQKLCEAVIEHFKDQRDLSLLVLKVPLLREHSTDKLIEVLEQQAEDSVEKQLALAVLLILRNRSSKAELILERMSQEKLCALLQLHWYLLFESMGNTKNGKSSMTFSELASMLMDRQYQQVLCSCLLYTLENKWQTLGKLLRIFMEYLSSSCDSCKGSQVLQTFLEMYLQSMVAAKNLNVERVDRATQEALKLLMRTYLSQLQILQMNFVKEPAATAAEMTNRYLFSDYRLEYFNKMPPFQALLLPSSDEKRRDAKCERSDAILRKVQALLCSKVLPGQVLQEMEAFLNLNEELRGRLSMQTALLNVQDAVLLLVEQCPQCLLQYAKDCFSKADEWKFLIASVQHKVLTLSHRSEDSKAFFYYRKLLNEILTFVATSMNLECLLNVFPQHMDYSLSGTISTAEKAFEEDEEDILRDIQDYDPYITLCKETMHANQIKKLITATGQQLLFTLNL